MKLKNVCVTVAALVLAVSMTACGSSSSTAASTSEAASAAETTAEPSAEAETSAEATADAETSIDKLTVTYVTSPLNVPTII